MPHRGSLRDQFPCRFGPDSHSKVPPMRNLNLRSALVLILLSLLVTACGPHQVKGEAPFVSIAALNLQGDRLIASLNVRNINDVIMDIDSADFSIRVRDTELFRHNGPLTLDIDPNATEELRVERDPGAFSRELLDALASGRETSLPFLLEGRVHTRTDGNLSFRHDGHLYTVPGRPGQFRSASSRAHDDR